LSKLFCISVNYLISCFNKGDINDVLSEIHNLNGIDDLILIDENNDFEFIFFKKIIEEKPNINIRIIDFSKLKSFLSIPHVLINYYAKQKSINQIYFFSSDGLYKRIIEFKDYLSLIDDNHIAILEPNLNTSVFSKTLWLRETNNKEKILASKLISTLTIEKKKKLFIDISTLIHFDHATGIQRVVKELTEQLVSYETDVDVHVIYSYPNHTHFYYAFKESVLGYKVSDQYEGLHKNIVDFSEGDVLLFLDLTTLNVSTKSELIQNLQYMGVSVCAVVYDLLPISYPKYFVPDLVKDFEQWLKTVISMDLAISISKDVQNKLINWISEKNLETHPNFKTDFFHLGANFGSTKVEHNNTTNQLSFLNRNKKTFLMVGTIEPRKGHSIVLDAFDELWLEAKDINLVIVGRPGWCNDVLIERLNKHKNLNKNLFWLRDLSDQSLDVLYRECTCLIVASEGEGFGLPLIEAAQYGLPIIARDIPIFKEVAQEHAYYFSENLFESIKKWLLKFDQNDHPASDGMSYKTWSESTDDLMKILLKLFLRR
jgi:glycosyltransferase involved in cell wall biosynthesis